MRRWIPFRTALGLSLILLGGALSLAAQPIDPARGIDSRVDYRSLARFGPWDDRNYLLTQEDLAYLAPNEAELSVRVPLFFRVEMRKAWPELSQEGPVQYPRSALQIFRQMFGGFLIDGRIYGGVELREGRYLVDLRDGGVERRIFDRQLFDNEDQRFLDGDVRVTSPVGAAESAIKISPVNTDRVVAGSNGPSSGQKMHFSTDGGESWTQSAALPQGGTCCDPAVDWSADGDFAYASALGACGFSGCTNYFYRSADGGQTWNDLESVTPGDPRREIGSGTDKEFIHVDKHPGSPFVDNLYMTWHEANIMKFSRSGDFGNTWSAKVSVSSGSGEQGLGSDITSDGDGDVFYVWPAFNSRTILVRRSTDGGASFEPTVRIADTEASFIFPIPSIETREVFVYVSADSDLSAGPFGGNVYVAWTDSTAPTGGNPASNHARIQVAASSDGGQTWAVTTPHETADMNAVDRWHPWLAVGPDGQVHVVFYDTRRDPSRESVDLFYAASSDGAQSWSTPIRLTAEISPNIADGFEFGDYNGADAVLNDVIAVFTDNRNEGGGGSDSVDVYAAGISGGGGGGYTLSSPVPGEAGVDNTLTVAGATPGASSFYLAGVSGGSTPVPGCPGVTVAISDVLILGSEVADPGGEASLVVFVPPAGSGRTIRLQAVEQSSCEVSNLVTFSFP